MVHIVDIGKKIITYIILNVILETVSLSITTEYHYQADNVLMTANSQVTDYHVTQSQHSCYLCSQRVRGLNYHYIVIVATVSRRPHIF